MLAKLKIQRERLRPLVRNVLLWLAASCVGAIFVAVLGEFFVKWAEEAGWYSDPSQRARRFMNAVGWLLTSSWFVVPTAFIAGIATGVRVDWLLRRLDTSQLATPRALIQAIDDLFAEGTRERNRLIPPLPNFDYTAERARLVAWSDRVLAALEAAQVAVAEASRFRTLNLYEPAFHTIGGKTSGQEQLESIWNEKLHRLRAIIDSVGS